MTRREHVALLASWRRDRRGLRSFKHFKAVYGSTILAKRATVKKLTGRYPGRGSGLKHTASKLAGWKKMGQSRRILFAYRKTGNLRNWLLQTFQLHGPQISTATLHTYGRRIGKTPAIINKSLRDLAKKGTHTVELFKRGRWMIAMVTPAIPPKASEPVQKKLVARTPDTQDENRSDNPAFKTIDFLLPVADYNILRIAAGLHNTTPTRAVMDIVRTRIKEFRESIAKLDVDSVKL